jgi:hypothetical protein
MIETQKMNFQQIYLYLIFWGLTIATPFALVMGYLGIMFMAICTAAFITTIHLLVSWEIWKQIIIRLKKKTKVDEVIPKKVISVPKREITPISIHNSTNSNNNIVSEKDSTAKEETKPVVESDTPTSLSLNGLEKEFRSLGGNND